MANNKEKGILGERLAASILCKQGYQILEKNYRALGCEIDIIAQKEGILVFAEVKTRTSFVNGFPAEAVTVAKQKHIKKAANMYLAARHAFEQDCRFDVIEILIQGEKRFYRHLEDAF